WFCVAWANPPSKTLRRSFVKRNAYSRRLARITLIADRGFHEFDWAQKCLKIGWNYLIRVTNNTYICFPDGRWVSIEQLGVKRGQRRYFNNIALTRNHAFHCNLMVTWKEATVKQPAELCAVITNLRPVS